MSKSSILAFALGCLLTVGGILVAQPRRDVSHFVHPNLAAAQRLCQQAYRRILDAQRANEFDLGGHAQRAKALLEQANHELKEAAEASNRRHRR